MSDSGFLSAAWPLQVKAVGVQLPSASRRDGGAEPIQAETTAVDS